jgi:hypothetical protein
VFVCTGTEGRSHRVHGLTPGNGHVKASFYCASIIINIITKIPTTIWRRTVVSAHLQFFWDRKIGGDSASELGQGIHEGTPPPEKENRPAALRDIPWIVTLLGGWTFIAAQIIAVRRWTVLDALSQNDRYATTIFLFTASINHQIASISIYNTFAQFSPPSEATWMDEKVLKERGWVESQPAWSRDMWRNTSGRRDTVHNNEKGRRGGGCGM